MDILRTKTSSTNREKLGTDEIERGKTLTRYLTERDVTAQPGAVGIRDEWMDSVGYVKCRRCGGKPKEKDQYIREQHRWTAEYRPRSDKDRTLKTLRVTWTMGGHLGRYANKKDTLVTELYPRAEARRWAFLSRSYMNILHINLSQGSHRVTETSQKRSNDNVQWGGYQPYFTDGIFVSPYVYDGEAHAIGGQGNGAHAGARCPGRERTELWMKKIADKCLRRDLRQDQLCRSNSVRNRWHTVLAQGADGGTCIHSKIAVCSEKWDSYPFSFAEKNSILPIGPHFESGQIQVESIGHISQSSVTISDVIPHLSTEDQ